MSCPYSDYIGPEKGEMMDKWIKFELLKDFGLTKLWEVNTRKDIPLGCIKWYGPWRRYCFFPVAGTVYSSGCLKDISEFIKREMKARK